MHKPLATIALVCVAAIGLAAQSKPLAGEDWVALFNGKDLTGWVEVGKEKWTVEDGVIHGQAVTQDAGAADIDEIDGVLPRGPERTFPQQRPSLPDATRFLRHTARPPHPGGPPFAGGLFKIC